MTDNTDATRLDPRWSGAEPLDLAAIRTQLDDPYNCMHPNARRDLTALLAEVERLTAERDEARAISDVFERTMKTAGKEIKRLQAEVEAHEGELGDMRASLSAAEAEADAMRPVVEKVRALAAAWTQNANHDPWSNIAFHEASTELFGILDALSAAEPSGVDSGTSEPGSAASVDAGPVGGGILSCSRCGSNPPMNPGDRYADGTPSNFARYCARCIDRCHEATDFAHECVICASPTDATGATP